MEWGGLGDTSRMARRFSKPREQEILSAYQEWNSDTETINELCARLDISRQALYSVLQRNDVPLKGRDAQVLSRGDAITKEMAKSALMVLIEEVTKCRQINAELEEENFSLRASLAERPGSSPVPPRKPAPRSR